MIPQTLAFVLGAVAIGLGLLALLAAVASRHGEEP